MAFQLLPGEMPRPTVSCHRRGHHLGARSLWQDKETSAGSPGDPASWAKLSKTALLPACPRGSGREEGRDGCSCGECCTRVCLRLCHWTQSKFNYPETNKQTEDTCLTERNAPPREGLPQPALRAPGSACSTTRGWRSPWGAGSHPEPQKWTN